MLAVRAGSTYRVHMEPTSDRYLGRQPLVTLSLALAIGACSPGTAEVHLDDAGTGADTSNSGPRDAGTTPFDAAGDASHIAPDLDRASPDVPHVPDVPTPVDSGDPFCDAIAPVADPAQNRTHIEDCLGRVGVARLAPGMFAIDRKILMPDGARLLGDETRPTITLQGPDQSVVELHNRNEVAFLGLDANHNLTVPHGAILFFRGNDSSAHDNDVFNATGPVDLDHVTGVRFWYDEPIGQHGNRASRNVIRDVQYGVIFDLHPNGTDNLLDGNTIRDIRCDAVSFRGYGRAHNNEMFRLGRQCLNPPESPIPGGGIYTLENPHGAEIIGNHVYDACGMPLDLDRASNLVIRGNTFERPGFTGAPGYGACGSGITAHLLDISASTIEDNVFRKGAGPVGSDPNRVMSASGDGVPSDLPAAANTAVAFMLTHRRDEPLWTATGNTIRNNTFLANCAAPCVGLGYFAGRGTGYDLGGQWSAATTNYFTRNTPFGSNIGSKRCGGNWYAANSVCGADPDCNADDGQHEGAGHDALRNDNCPFYP